MLDSNKQNVNRAIINGYKMKFKLQHKRVWSKFMLKLIPIPRIN